MALECKYLGFSACVITDHVYRAGNGDSCSLNQEKFEKALKEARSVADELNYPVILGAEMTVGYGEEILVFGVEAIKYLLYFRDNKGEILINDLRNARENYSCATIMAHPHKPEQWCDLDVLDGFEFCNHGAPQFWHSPVPENFSTLTPWSNSDAHQDFGLCLSWNYVDVEVHGEKTLIDLIKNHAPIKFHNSWARTLADVFLESEREFNDV
jgi:hypothetical protein